jgi:hypothetical protein
MSEAISTKSMRLDREKTPKTPARDLRLALKRMKEVL